MSRLCFIRKSEHKENDNLISLRLRWNGYSP